MRTFITSPIICKAGGHRPPAYLILKLYGLLHSENILGDPLNPFTHPEAAEAENDYKDDNKPNAVVAKKAAATHCNFLLIMK
jgi:hypothetical protein